MTTEYHSLEHASENLKNNKDFVLAEVERDGRALYFASRELRNDKDVVLAAVKQDGLSLGYASSILQNDKGVVLAAVKQTGWTLYFASRRLRDDKEIVISAVKQDGRALQFASPGLKNDRDVVFAAINQGGEYVLEHASIELQEQWKICKYKKPLVYEKINDDGIQCLIGHCEIKDGDLYYKCSNEKIKECHYYLKENFDIWENQSSDDKCIYCFEKLIYVIFINEDKK